MLEAGYIDFFKYLIFGTLYVAQDPLQVLLQKKKKISNEDKYIISFHQKKTVRSFHFINV